MRRQLILCDTAADLRADGAPNGCIVRLMGKNVVNDAWANTFYEYRATSLLSDNDDTQFKPTGFTEGCWVQIPMPALMLSQSSVVRSLNSAFKISDNYSCFANYSVLISVTSVLVGSNMGQVLMEISPNGTTGWVNISQSTLEVAGVVSTIKNTQTVGGFVPRGYFVRLTTAESGGAAKSFAYQNGQESLI